MKHFYRSFHFTKSFLFCGIKKKLALLLTCMAFGGSIAHLQAAASTLNMTLSSANGGTETLITWNFGGPVLSPSSTGTTLNGMWGSVDFSPADSFINAGYFTTGSMFSVTGAGTMADVSPGGQSRQINQVGFNNDGVHPNAISMVYATPFTTLSSATSLLSYTPGTDSYTLNTPFAAFKVGTYAYAGTETVDGLNMTLTVNPVPEPSTYALLGFGICAVTLAYHRKKKIA